MPRITNIKLFRRLEQHTLSLSYDRLSISELQDKIPPSYAQLKAYLGELREVMVGNPYVAYHRIEEGEFTVEIGFLVAQPLPGKDDITPGVIPESLVVSCMFLGPYNGMTPIYHEMETWINAKDLEICGSAYEYYYNGRNFPPENYLTKIVMPVV